VLRWARESIGLVPVAAARKIGVPDGRVAEWEAGTAMPTIAQLRKAADVYKRPLGVFFLPETLVDFDTMRDFRRGTEHRDHRTRRICLRLLYCRHGALEPEMVRRHVLDRIRALTLGSNEQEALAPVGFFMSRLAAVDPSTAADFLVEASVHVQGLPGGSWRARRGHRWRPGIADVVVRSPHVRWRQLMRELTAGDADILIQAVDISINSRKGEPGRLPGGRADRRAGARGVSELMRAPAAH
jgi:transcriptional regulator with XRE-family HTH domain